MSDSLARDGAPDDLVELGRVVSAYGVQGWIKIQPFSAQADVLRESKQWWLIRPAPPSAQGVVASVPRPVQVDTVRSQGATLVARLRGMSDRDVAEAMKGEIVCVSRSLFPAADDDEYYWIDLVGCALYGHDDAGQDTLIGVVDEVLDNGAHGVLKVHLQREAASGAAPEPVLDSKGRPAEMLVPFVSAHIQSVDLAARRISSDWPADF